MALHPNSQTLNWIICITGSQWIHWWPCIQTPRPWIGLSAWLAVSGSIDGLASKLSDLELDYLHDWQSVDPLMALHPNSEPRGTPHYQWCKIWATQDVLHVLQTIHAAALTECPKATVSNATLRYNRPRSEACPPRMSAPGWVPYIGESIPLARNYPSTGSSGMHSV